MATNNTVRYQHVHAILLRWKDVDEREREEFETQLTGLKEEFESYRYTVEVYEIESEEAYLKLNTKLTEFLRHDNKDTLLIIYYGGHGINGHNSHCIWLRDNPEDQEAAECSKGNPRIDWSALQVIFLSDQRASDVLFILDCCFAAASSDYRTETANTVEAIVAAGFAGLAPLRGSDSFTKFLVDELKHVRATEKSIVASVLVRDILARSNRERGSDTRDTRVTPHHFPFHDGRSFIELRPLPHRSTGPPPPSARERASTTPSSSTLPALITEPVSSTRPAPTTEFAPTSEPAPTPEPTPTSNPALTTEPAAPELPRTPQTREIPAPANFSLSGTAGQSLNINLHVHSRPSGAPYPSNPSRNRTSWPARSPRRPDPLQELTWRRSTPEHAPVVNSSSRIGPRHGASNFSETLGPTASRGQPHWGSGSYGDSSSITSYASGLMTPVQPVPASTLGLAIPLNLASRYPINAENTIRVICIPPSNEQDNWQTQGSSPFVTCTIETVLLTGRGTGYKALSWYYNKNDELKSKLNVLVDDAKGNTSMVPVPIPDDLFRAFCDISQRSNKATYIWVQLLCVDKDNKEEERRQTELLSHIFKNATEVIIWPGPATQSTNTALEFVIDVIDFRYIDQLLNKGSAKWQALVEYMNMPYFKRRWNFLEVAFARFPMIYCGEARVSWSDFCDAVTLLGSRYEEVRLKLEINSEKSPERKIVTLPDLRALAAYTFIESSRQLFIRDPSGSIIDFCSLDKLVTTLPALESWHPNAVIEALLPLAKDSEKWRNGLKGPSQAYQHFVHYSTAVSGSLDVVCRPWAPVQKILNKRNNPKANQLPTWVCLIDKHPFGAWSQSSETSGQIPGRQNGEVFASLPDRVLYKASKGTLARPVFGYSDPPNNLKYDGTMTVSGFKIGSIDKVFGRSLEGIIPEEWIVELSKAWLKELEREGTFNWDEAHQVPNHLWRILVADRGPGGTPPPVWYPRACHYWLRRTGGKDVTYQHLKGDQHPSIVVEFLMRVRAVIWNRCLLRLINDKDGSDLHGLGPAGMEEDDIICILHGCSVPVVLRKEMDHYKLIGECFVYGVMEGEAMEWDRKVQEFLLV